MRLILAFLIAAILLVFPVLLPPDHEVTQVQHEENDPPVQPHPKSKKHKQKN